MKEFFLGMDEELLIAKETPNGYTTFSRLNGLQPTRLAFDPQNERVIYCGTSNNGLWKSEDGGDNWSKIGNEKQLGIRSERVTSVAVRPSKKTSENNIVYAGTEPSMLYYSNDKGVTWHEFTGIQTLPSKRNWSFPPRPYTHYVRWITPSYLNEEHLSISIEAGAFIRTKDHGTTWIDRTENSPIDIHTLLAHPKSPGKLYAACGDGVHKKGHSYAESDDEGQSWQYMSAGLENHPYAYNMVVNPNDPYDRIISAAKNAAHAHSLSEYSAIYRKQGNHPWADITAGLPENSSSIHNLAADPTSPGVFYAMNNYGIYRLKKKATKWEKLGISWKDKYLNQRPSCFIVKEV
ncbi:MAG: hypothetical protein L0J87_07290 [Tetragenococcus koreensis]|nr:hypothetical protein [Tetragenococcus koreensis]